MKKPYIICHMIASIDGRIDCDMTDKIDDTEHYYEVLDKLSCNATLEGRVTLQKHYADNSDEAFLAHYNLMHSRSYKLAGRQTYKAKESDRWAVGVDTHGSLYWGDNTEELFGAPLVMLIGGWIPQQYLDFLKSKGISYIVTAENFNNDIDLEEAMDILVEQFGVKRLALTGGGHINGSFLDLGMIDEISMMYAPGVDAREGFAASFDGRKKNSEPIRLSLLGVEQLDDIIWARYAVRPTEAKPNTKV